MVARFADFRWAWRVLGLVLVAGFLAACGSKTVTLGRFALSSEMPVTVEGKFSRCSMGWQFLFAFPANATEPQGTVDIYLENRGDKALSFTPVLRTGTVVTIEPGASTQVFSGKLAELRLLGRGMDMDMWFGTTLERAVKYKLRIVPHLPAGEKVELEVLGHHSGQGL
jgi:hypothetical protein